MSCRKILLVEDDPEIREPLAQYLELESFDVATAANGRDALDYLRRTGDEPCLILLDLMMPVMNGWEFLELKNQNYMFASIPVLIVSAVADPPKQLPGVRGQLRKPIDMDRLLRVCQAYCKQESATGEIPKAA